MWGGLDASRAGWGGAQIDFVNVCRAYRWPGGGRWTQGYSWLMAKRQSYPFGKHVQEHQMLGTPDTWFNTRYSSTWFTIKNRYLV